MGDRNNPIKFGPEWLRNLSRERNASSSASNSQSPSATGGTSGSAAGAAGGGIATSTASPPNTSNTSNTAPKVQLAKLRYGREEMLALYDRTSEAPPELKYIDILYQPRGKPPVALNNSFEEEMRDAMRTGPPIGPMTGGERFGIGRGMGRGVNVTEGRGRARMPFVRQLSAGRGASWHLGSPRMPGFGAGADEEPTASLRSWNNNNGGNSAARGSGTEQTEWTPNKMYRSKRPGSNTNWRQSRDEEEWRVSDNNRTRSGQPDKWDRDWGERPTPDKQSWGSNRRNWVGGDSQNEENLPEWAVDNAEACAGTFDSSGAFHGYSNDDSNLPKTQESAYALTRSHTQGSFVRSKTAEEGSDEWWASEKAKKLSPKRFDASDVKFKKSNSVIPELSSSTNAKTSTSKEESPVNKGSEKPDTPTSTTELTENNASNIDDCFNSKKVRFSESKTFDALMRSDINLEEASDERGNFQSVMINSNNSLRQKHQNLVPANNNSNRQQNRKPGILRLIQNSGGQNSESELQKQHGTPDSKIVDDIMQLTLEDKEIIAKLPIASDSGSQTTGNPGISSAILSSVNSVSQMTSPAMQLRMSSPVHPTQGLAMTPKSNMASSGIQATGLPSPGMQQVGISNSALNASLGLPIGGPSNNPMGQAMGIPIQGISSPVIPNQGLANTVGSAGLQPGGQGLPGFQTGGVHPGLSGSNVVNSSLFMGQSPNPTSLQSAGDMQMSHGTQGNLFPLHGLQHSGSQAAFNSAMYGNIMQQNPVQTPPPSQNMAEQWYYEDPKKNIQGPFSSKEMYHWYRAGFFNETLMVRRACDAVMRPLGSYGPMVPFAQMDILSSFPLASSFESRSQGSHESLITHSSQPGLGLDVMNMSNMSENNAMDTMQFGTVGLRNPPFGQQQMVDSLWSQPAPPDLMWMQQAMNARNETRVNNLPMFFWDHQASTIASNALLPEEIAKGMKTEDQILAQLRASQNIPAPPKIPFPSKQPVAPVTPTSGSEGAFPPKINATPNLEELQKLIQEDTLKDAPHVAEAKINNGAPQQIEDTFLSEPNQQEPQAQNKSIPEPKAVKQTKTESEKSSKNKENNITKTKNNKKPKDDKKEDSVELKNKEDEALLAERRSAEPSPSKSKKEEKINNKKELDKEKKEWIKEGFTIVKTEKTSNKDKKKADDNKIVEDAERKRREEERLAAEEEKKKRQLELLKKQQELQQQHQRLAAESIMKKAPWSASNQTMQAPSKDGMTLAEIQRLEREKKLEQMKEQQQMMQIIAQQQAAALAREQEMQAGLGWAKKKANLSTPGQSLAEIQAEARKQAVAATAAAAASQALEEAQAAAQQAPVNSVPWGNSHNGGGFWDTQPNQPSKPQEPPKPVDTNKVKKKPTVSAPAKKEVTPSAEFETWCTTVLASWSAKVDVPTFVGFLKDIESPYEVKDYVKCYLGDSKDSNDFARQFLERRSKLLRVGMVTPSDDLCSPAMAVNPRTTSGSDYQEVKCKGKKTKKNKMLKVDARILGFSVTAAEDRINVGDIDSV